MGKKKIIELGVNRRKINKQEKNTKQIGFAGNKPYLLIGA